MPDATFYFETSAAVVLVAQTAVFHQMALSSLEVVPIATLTVWPMKSAKEQRAVLAALAIFQQVTAGVETVNPRGNKEECSSNCCCPEIHWHFEMGYSAAKT